jgi:predicted nuclease of predicted toxin-antitoxin system
MKILVDMNLSPRWAEFLAAEGLLAVHWSSIGPGDTSDTEIMEFARCNDSIVMTQDLDFSAILAATNGDKPSVIQIRSEDTSPETIGTRVVAALHQHEADLMLGAIVAIDAVRARVRVLPLRSAVL